MRTHVTFLSNAFNQTEVKENFFNDCCFGEDVASWMLPLLKPHLVSFDLDPDPCQEDWGWEILLGQQELRFFIGVGQYPRNDELRWLCFVEPLPPLYTKVVPFYRRWHASRYEDGCQLIANAVHRVLVDSGEISCIRWYTKDDFMKGREDSWTDRPTDL